MWSVSEGLVAFSTTPSKLRVRLDQRGQFYKRAGNFSRKHISAVGADGCIAGVFRYGIHRVCRTFRGGVVAPSFRVGGGVRGRLAHSSAARFGALQLGRPY